MIKPGEIQKIAGRLGIRDTQVEKDYVIEWLLMGISCNNYLKGKLIFKGGTALRKIYYKNYRLSEDLDFTFYSKDFNHIEIKENFQTMIEWVKNKSRISLDIQDVNEKFNNFYIGYIGPLGGKGINKSIKIDIADNEILCNTPEEKNVIVGYSDIQNKFKILSYSIGEIIAEKLRSLMQRTMPRDLYDVWYLFEKENYDIKEYLLEFKQKAEFKNLNPNDLFKLLQIKREVFNRNWNNHLTNQIKEIPKFAEVWRKLGKHFNKLEDF